MKHQRVYHKHSERRITDEALDCPSRKFGYATKAVARQEIAALIRDRGITYEINAYKCPFCKCWHMTSKPQY